MTVLTDSSTQRVVITNAASASVQLAQRAATSASAYAPYETRAAFEAATIPPEVKRAAFKVGDKVLDVVRSETATGADVAITSADGANWVPNEIALAEHFEDQAAFYAYLGAGATYTKRTVKISDLGLTGDASERADQKIEAALNYLIDVGGGALEIDRKGTYTFEAQCYPDRFASGTIRIEGKEPHWFKAASGLDTSILKFHSGLTAPGDGQLILDQVNIDNSEGSTTPGAAGCTCIELEYFGVATLNNCRGYGGDADPADTNTRSDSFLTCNEIEAMIVNNAKVQGMGDAVFYPSWNNTNGEKGGYLEVNGGEFKLNNQVLTSKRNFELCVINNISAIKNSAVLSTQWVNNGGWVKPGHRIEVNGGVFRKNKAGIFVLKRESTGYMRGATIEDIGYDIDGTGNVGVNAVAIQLQGADNVVIEENHFIMKDWTPVSEYAFKHLNDATDGRYAGGGHTIQGNTYVNWSRYAQGGAAEADGGAAGEVAEKPSIYRSERFVSLGASNRYAASFRDDQKISFWEFDGANDPVYKSRVDGTEYPDIDEGSNANGRYVRRPDGTQTCILEQSATATASTLAGSVYHSAEVGWTFPIAFKSGTLPHVSAPCVRSSAPRWATARPASNSSALFRIWSPTSSGALDCVLKAEGFWR